MEELHTLFQNVGNYVPGAMVLKSQETWKHKHHLINNGYILGLYFMHAVNYVHSNVWKEHTSSISRMTKLVQVDDKML